MKKEENGDVAESRYYTYNLSNQLVEVELYNGKKTTTVSYEYDADGNLISENGKDGNDKVELTYTYTVENRLEAVYDGKELLMAAAYDGDGNRVFQLNYNLHTDEDWKGNSGNGNGSNKDNSGSGNNGNGNNKNKNKDKNGNGNTTNAEENTSQNQCGILFPIDSETSNTEEYLIGLIKTTGKEKNYELIEYINDVNREYAEVLVEQNINGADDTTYVYGVERLSADRFDDSTGYYLFDPRGSVTGITNEDGQIYQSYRYSVNGEITFGAPAYENEYTYNGESYNPNIESQYLRARYYDVTIAAFITEDFYPQDMWKLWNITEPLTLNRYNYCVSSPLNYKDKSGHWLYEWEKEQILNHTFNEYEKMEKRASVDLALTFLSALHELSLPHASVDFVLNYDYRNAYFEHVIYEAGRKNANHECDIIGYGESTKQLIMQFEGTPFLKPRINDNGSFTIGYGYDFTEEEDPEMFNRYLKREENGEIVVIGTMSIEEAEETIKKAADKKGITSAVKMFINGEGFGNNTRLEFNQNQYDVLFSYFYANGKYVFTNSKYEEWVSYGGEYAERAEARVTLRDYIINNNGNYDAATLIELFIKSKGPNVKYDYEDRRSREGKLFVS